MLLAALGAGERRPVLARRTNGGVEQRGLDLIQRRRRRLCKQRPDLGRCDRAARDRGRRRLLDADGCLEARVAPARISARPHRVVAEFGCELFVVAAVGRCRRRRKRAALASIAAKSGTARNRHVSVKYRARVRARGRATRLVAHVEQSRRFVQLTPRGSACSIAIGTGLSDSEPGSAQAQVVVADVHAAREELRSRGLDVGEV